MDFIPLPGREPGNTFQRLRFDNLLPGAGQRVFFALTGERKPPWTFTVWSGEPRALTLEVTVEESRDGIDWVAARRRRFDGFSLEIWRG